MIESGSLLPELARRMNTGRLEMTDGAEQETQRGYLVSDDNAKYVADLRKYYPWMVRRARLYVPECDTEQVANAALCDAHAPNRNRPDPSEVPRIKMWLDELIDWRAKAYWKERGKYANEVPCEDISVVAHAQTVDLAKQIEDRECIRIMLESLPRERRDVFLACAIDGVSIEQIAREHGVKENTVYSWIHFTRNELRAKWNELQSATWKGVRQLIPLLFFRKVWQRIFTPDCEVPQGEARTAGSSITGIPGPLVLGAVASVFILGSTPPKLSAAGNERIEISTNAPRPEESVVVAFYRAEITGSTGITRAVAPAPKEFARVSNDRQAWNRSATNEDKPDTLDEALLIRARAAYNKGNYAKANALLDEHQATFPKSRFADMRNGLREITFKAMTAARQ